MASEKGLYWMAVGVLALGVSNSFINRHSDWAQCLADRSQLLVEQVSGQAMRYAAITEMTFGRSDAAFGRSQAAVARVQTCLASVQASIAPHQAEMIRKQTEKVHGIAIEQMQHAVVMCPQQNFDVDVVDTPEAPDDDTI
jgi:hypothetical protein